MPVGTVIDVSSTPDAAILEVWDMARDGGQFTRYRIGIRLGGLPPAFGDRARWETGRMILYLRRALEAVTSNERHGDFGNVEELMILRRPVKIEA